MRHVFPYSVERYARKYSEEYHTRFINEPMDCDEVEDVVKVFRIWLNYFQGNIDNNEREEMLAGVGV